MSKPGERVFTWDNDIYNEYSGFKIAEEKTEVAKDDKTVKDDYEDYIYKTPKRKRRSSSGNSSHHSYHSHHKSHRKKHKKHKKHKMKTWKKVLLIVACVFMSIVLIVAATTVFLFFRGQSELFTDDIQISSPEGIDAMVQDGGQYIVYNGVTYKYNDKVTSMLFMGIDKKGLDDKTVEGTGGQADVIVLMAMDLNNRQLTMLNIPRDTMTDVSVYSAGGYYTGMQRQQICLSYAYGDGKESSCANTLASVKRIFYNIPISTYYSLDLEGLVALNDAIGGVDVVSPETIEKFKAGESYHLMGVDADRFIEARIHDKAEANDLRMKRQQVYTKNFISKTMSEVKSNPSVALSLYNESAPYSCTNFTPAKVTYLSEDIATHGSLHTDIVNVPGKTTLNKNESAEFTISEKEFYEQFLSVFYEKM